MKLSRAIERGRFLLPDTDHLSFCGCALAMALVAVGKQPCDAYSPDLKYLERSMIWRDAQLAEWPWLAEFFDDPTGGVPMHAIDIISNLFAEVENDLRTLDSLVEWVRSVEPPEEEASVKEEPAECVAV